MTPLKYAKKCFHVVSGRVSDGMGGFVTGYVDGDSFMASIVQAGQPLVRIAEQQTLLGEYNVYVALDAALPEFALFKRELDGQYFRVISSENDKVTPTSSMLRFKVLSAEKYKLPKGGTP